ncbi:MAG: HAD family phosphatase [Spirochaetales bacterium]|nr:HAD family phosphatase [Spirochaetales bacterium]
MPSIKLICTDIDGTLIRPDHTISPRTKRAIQDAHSRGIIIALISGRIGKSLVKIQKELGITGPLGTLNGSLVLDEKGRPILEHPLHHEEIHQILDWVEHTDLNAFVYTNTDWYASKEGYWTEHELKVTGFKGIVRSFHENEGKLGADEQPFKVLCMHEDPEYLSRMEQRLVERMGPRFTILRSGPIYLEIFHRGVDKGDAVRALATHYSLPREAVMAVGDYYNDVAMLKAAGCSVAMGNAPDDIKAMVDTVTAPNTEDGLALAIEAVL